MTALPLTAAPAPQTRARPAHGLVTVLILLALLPRLGFLARPFESDAGLYIYMGKAVVTGQTLYRDFYETKLPGVPLFTAACYACFGHHWAPYVLLQTAMAVASALLLANLARRHLGRGAHQPALLFALVFLNFSPTAYRGFQLETVQIFFACLAAYFGLHDSTHAAPRRSAILLGLFAGAAAMIKPTAAAVAGAYLLCALVRRRNFLPTFLATIAGGVIVPALVLLWTWRAGLLPEIPALLREISLYGSGTPLVADDLFKPLCVLIIAGFPFLIARTFRPTTPEQNAPFLLFATTWLVLECLGVLVQKRMYAYHFLPLAAPLTLLFAHACRAGRRPVILAAAFGPILLLSLLRTQYDLRTLLTQSSPNLPESDYLLGHAAPTDTVTGDAIERLLMETRLPCGTRYAHLFYFANHDAAPLEYGQRYLEDLATRRPTWAVFETDRAAHRLRQCESLPMYSENPTRRVNFLATCARIESYLAAHYTPVATVAEKTIFHRRD